MRTIEVSEDLGRRQGDPFAFCATLAGDTDQERGGFGRTEREAVTMLARAHGDCFSHFTKRATIERLAVR